MKWSRLFAAQQRAPRLAATPELEAALSALLAQAHAAWPGVRLDERRFFGYLAERLPSGAEVAALQALRTGDLYLACACADGVAEALARFEEHCFRDLHRLLRRVALPGVSAEDVA